jgi:N-methylhydantoinase B
MDPITREVVRNALAAIVDEMAVTIVRTSYSGIVRDVMDFSTALCNPNGEMVAQGLTLPLHLGAFPAAMRSVLAKFGDDLRPGDVYILNDPYAGGMHLPDVFMFKPAYLGDTLLGFPCVIAHQADIGGRVPGGNSCDSTEIYQEGLRIPPSRLYGAGVENETLFDVIAENVRLPEIVRGDLNAQLAALHVGERELVRLTERYSAGALAAYEADLLALSEAMARQEIATWPDGCYRFTDYVDDDGVVADRPVRIDVVLTIAGDSLTVDLGGSSPQVDGAINSTLSSTTSAALLAIRSLMHPRLPNNAGFFRPITVHAPAGLVVNPRPPAACAARALTCYRIVDAVMGALAQAIPDRVFAAGEGGVSAVMIGGRDAGGNAYVLLDTVGCCWGARPNKDGVDGITCIAVNISNTPVEVVERDYPVRVERYGFVADTGGPGKFRGGLAIEREYRFTGGQAVLQIRSDRRSHPPYGLAGGRPGAPSTSFLATNGRRSLLPSKVTAAIGHDTTIRHQHAGGGGWGDPLTRDPVSVSEDVIDEKVSRHAALEEYAVVLDTEGRVDVARTAEMRTARRR